MEKIPVTASIVLEVSDGRLAAVKDSLQLEELKRNYEENSEYYTSEASEETSSYENEGSGTGAAPEENPGYFD